VKDKLAKLTEALSKKPGASESEIRAIEEGFRARLPVEYREFLQATNGAEGSVGANSYLVIWSTGEVVSLNESSPIGLDHPHLLLIGSNAATGKFAFDTRTYPMVIVEVDDYDPGYFELRGGNFVEFVEALAAK
jgi:SMI1 / KNR4 family (SUKH-1)